MNRLEVIRKIDDLQDTNCQTCTLIATAERRKGSIRYCIEQCPIGKQLQDLGKELTKKERKPVGEKKIVLDQDSYKKFKASGKTDTAIAKEYGITGATLSYHKKKWFNEAVKPELKIVEPVEATEKPIESKPIKQDKIVEYAALINELSDKVKKQEEVEKALQEIVTVYQAEEVEWKRKQEEIKSLTKQVEYLEDKRLEEKELYLDTLEQLKNKDYELENLKRASENNRTAMEGFVKENQSLRNMVKEMVGLWA